MSISVALQPLYVITLELTSGPVPLQVAIGGGSGSGGGSVGLSAYQIALAAGFVGDEAAWLASLVGPAGAAGADGADGAIGPQGPAGADGQSVTVVVVANVGLIPEPPDANTLYLVQA